MTSQPPLEVDPTAAADASTRTAPDRIPALQVYVPFKYDLGGPVVDHVAAMGPMRTVCDSVEEDRALTRSWNLSYLVRHAVVLRGNVGGGVVEMGGNTWQYQRALRLYPWLGVVSVDYVFSSFDDVINIADVYDDLVTWKNQDYLPYLRKCGATTPALDAHTSTTAPPPVDRHGDLVRGLRRDFRPLIDERPATYAFHDFRMCFVDRMSTLDWNAVHGLLLLSKAAPPATYRTEMPGIHAGDVDILSSGWATVVRGTDATPPRDLADVLGMFSLIHAQWFVCQLWINVYDRDFNRTSSGRVTSAHELTTAQLALAQDLTEVGYLDLMLKDPGLLRVARYFEETFRVRDHRRAAEQRLRLLEDYSRDQADYRRTVSSNRLQVLFALSAAGSIAALLPELLQVGREQLRPAALVTTAILVLLFVGFNLNYSLLRPRRRRGRFRRR